MPLPFLQSWYLQQCNGHWEHSHGITIESLDKQGWMVTIDLVETSLDNEAIEIVRRERSDKDWLVCEVSHQQFRGWGDSQKLIEILQVFEAWAIKER